MTVTTDHDQVIDISGDRDNPDSAGFLCVRGKATIDLPHHADRITTPLLRTSRAHDDWQPISWDAAMTRIVEKIESTQRDRVGMWFGHGALANDYGSFANVQLGLRFANMGGMQAWGGAMICWGLGGFGFGLTGTLDANTKEDMSANADLILQWGSNTTSQPNTARHLALAKKRGAHVIAIDVRVSEACTAAHDYYLVKPGTDAALALAMMHVIVRDDLHNKEFVTCHTVGFDELAAHLDDKTPAWAAAITGVDADRIEQLARRYATTPRAMLLVSGSSMYKDRNGWQASRAVSCLPGLTGAIGTPGAGFGPRHAANATGFSINRISNDEARPTGSYVPAQMSDIITAIATAKFDVMLFSGANPLSSFANAGRMEEGLRNTPLVVSHDLFLTETARRCADIVLPATTWLEDVGVKGTATHLYLMDRILDPVGEARSLTKLTIDLAARLNIDDFYPWSSETGHIDAVINTPASGHATVAALREENSMRAFNIEHVAYADRHFDTPSGKIEFFSERARQQGLPPLPDYTARPNDPFPLELRFGRSMNQFHSFYDAGAKLPNLAKRLRGPEVWISPEDAASRSIKDATLVTIFNDRGTFEARAKITDRAAAGTLWMRDGWPGMNHLTSGDASLPTPATDLFHFTSGQAAYDAFVDVSASS